MNEPLAVSYATWVAIEKASSGKIYLRGSTAWTGTADMIVRVDMTASEKALFDAAYSATTVLSEAGAVAEIIGIRLVPVQPSQPDGRRVVVISPSTEGWMIWVTSRGDDLNPTPPASGRGDGAKLKLIFTAPATQSVDLDFSEPVELHDGALYWQPADWGIDDEFSFSASIPAAAPVVNASNLGNCNLTDLGGYSLVTPAAGDGTHDIDLTVPQPIVPAKTGYWDADNLSGIVSAGNAGKADWNLITAPVESFFIKRVGMSNPLGTFDLDTYKAEWVSPAWKMRLSVTRASAGAGPYDVGGWLMFFRESST